MNYLIITLLCFQFSSFVHATEVMEHNNSSSLKPHTNNDLIRLNLEEKINFEKKINIVKVEIAKINKEREELTGNSLATKRWLKKYQNQVNDLERYLETINSLTPIDDIKLNIMLISDKYHIVDNF